MNEPRRTLSFRDATGPAPLDREWIVANGLGGYAAGTISGHVTRRYHGVLVAGLQAPLGRTMMLNELSERVVLPGGHAIRLGGADRAPSAAGPARHGFLAEFRIECGVPAWRYELDGFAIEKRLVMPHRQNTVFVQYRMEGRPGAPVRLEVHPAMHFRAADAEVDSAPAVPYAVTVAADRYEIAAAPFPPLRFLLHGKGAAFTVDRRQIREVQYGIEASRGYPSRGELWSPGYFHVDLAPDRSACLVASTERWERAAALAPDDAFALDRERRQRLLERTAPAAREGPGAELTLAADQFLITPAGRIEDSARARAAGYEVRTVIAGYHWFTDWGRDTMIGLEGLTLTTGRFADASAILKTFAYYVKDGLIPNLFPEGQKDGLYHTADATLWFFHALHRYVQASGDRNTLRQVLPKLVEIYRWHVAGTRFGIGVDPADGLLRQGQQGYQLTWMDAKVGDWVVTPRRGKAVEINALWYNALCLLAGWLDEEQVDGADAREVAARAARAHESFNRRFWYAAGGFLYDVVDGASGDDASLRPNQLVAISLEHPVLDAERWGAVLATVERELLTPVGLRTLAPGSPDYKPRYDGDLRARDAAYHQGTVWPWLLGPFVDAWLKVHPGARTRARRFLEGLAPQLGVNCLGTLPEIFDAEAPFHPRGCVAQAWSVAEVLRTWVLTAAEEDA